MFLILKEPNLFLAFLILAEKRIGGRSSEIWGKLENCTGRREMYRKMKARINELRNKEIESDRMYGGVVLRALSEFALSFQAREKSGHRKNANSATRDIFRESPPF